MDDPILEQEAPPGVRVQLFPAAYGVGVSRDPGVGEGGQEPIEESSGARASGQQPRDRGER